MILLNGGFTYKMLFTMIGGFSIFVGIPVFTAIYYSLRHSSFYLIKVKDKGIGPKLIYGLGIFILTVLVLTTIIGCFLLYMLLTV